MTRWQICEALPLTAQLTVKTSPNVPVNSVTYLRMCDSLPGEQLWLIPAAWQAVAEAAGSPLHPPVTVGRSGQLTRQAAQPTEAGRCDRSAIWSHPILAGRVVAGRCRPRVLQPVPSPARKKAVAWSMAARVARVWLRALSSMKSWMVPS
jgi:hypothetical protein